MSTLTPDFSLQGRQEGSANGPQPLVNGHRRRSAERTTTVGLVFETALGLRKLIEPSLSCSCGPAAPWFEVLIRLSRSPGQRLRMSDLAAQTSLTPSGLTRAVDRLYDLGLVTREACSADRRGTYAALTDAGQQAMDVTMPRHEALLHEILEGVFNPDEEATFAALIRKLRDHVNPEAARMTDEDDLPLAPPACSPISVPAAAAPPSYVSQPRYGPPPLPHGGLPGHGARPQHAGTQPAHSTSHSTAPADAGRFR